MADSPPPLPEIGPRTLHRVDWKPVQPPQPEPKLGLHVGLFLLTCGTTFLSHFGTEPPWSWWEAAKNGLWYALPLMTILLCHESGHFFMCRRYGVPATLPYFIPIPPGVSLFGTLGAVIKMRGYMPTKKAIFDIGAAGPLFGFVLCLPCVAIGLAMSEVKVLTPETETFWQLGEPLIFKFFSKWIVGELPDNADIFLHPLAFAGWAGIFVTGLNLIPLGQLDGGHVLYALFGERANRFYRIGLILFLLVAALWFLPYLLFGVLLTLFGRRHPPAFDNGTPIGRGRTVLAFVMICIFLLSFTLKPISIPGSTHGLLDLLFRTVGHA